MFKRVLVAICVLVVAFICYKVYGPLIVENRRLASELENLKNDNTHLEQIVDELRYKQEQYKNDPDYVELTARREGLVRPDEKLFKYTDTEK